MLPRFKNLAAAFGGILRRRISFHDSHGGGGSHSQSLMFSAASAKSRVGSNCSSSDLLPFLGFSGRRTICHRFGLFRPQNASQPKRCYYVDRYNVHHFRRRGPVRFVQNPRKLVIVLVLGSGLLLTIYFSNLDTVPYSHRKHFILVSKEFERQLGERQFEEIKKQFRGKILPPHHPVSIRVRLIARDIIEALKRGTRHEQSWSDVAYGNASVAELDYRTVADPWASKSDEELKTDQWYAKDDVLDDKWVERSRSSGKQRGDKPCTDHLSGLNWEILVVDDPLVNAFCLPGGKIMVFTGLLAKFPHDDEIATVISHEVGHAVARHAAEGMTKNLWFAILQIIILQFIGMPDVVNAMSTLLLRLPFSRRMEVEADYIGLLLMASAGYNPIVAPSVYEKLGKLTGDSVLRNYLSTHPSGRKRAELLKDAKVMQEALTIYQARIAGSKTEGFL